MPASANWPDRTLISPILTVPCAFAVEMPSSSAMAQPNPTRNRVIVHPPGLLVAEQLQKNCTYLCWRGREVRYAAGVGSAPRRGGVPRCRGVRPPTCRAVLNAMELERPRADAFGHALHWRGQPRRPARHACELCLARPMASVPARIDAARLARRRQPETAETIAT